MLDRRGFMKFAGGAVVGTLGTPVIWKTLDDVSIWSQNWGWIPRLEKGISNSIVRTVSKLSPDSCGLAVRCVNGRPIRASGDAESPLSCGGLSPLSAAEVQMLYSPARLKRPLLRTSDGGYRTVSWDEASGLLVSKLKKVRHRKDMVCISGDESGSINEVLSGLCAAAGSPSGFYLMPGEAQTAAAAWSAMGGNGRVGYDFARSDYVLAVGANLFEDFGPVSANRRAWGANHPTDGKPRQVLHYAGAVQNSTAVAADKWIPIRPDTGTPFLLGVIHVLCHAGSMPSGFSALKTFVAEWTPEKAAGLSGASVQQIEATAHGLMQAKAPLVIVSSNGQGGAATPVILGLLINVMLGRLNREGGLRALPVFNPAVGGAMPYAAMMAQNLTAFTEKIASGAVKAPELLLISEANPAYALPTAGMKRLLKESAFKVALTCFLDETARQCDLILPAAAGLERQDDVVTPYGGGMMAYAVTKPVQKPLFEARPAGEVLLDCAARAEMFLGFTSYEKLLRAKAVRMGVDWELLERNVCVATDHTVDVHALILPIRVLTAAVDAFAKREKSGLAVATVRKCAFGTASSGLPPFATKLVGTDISGNALTARVNAATAKAHGLPLSRFAVLEAAGGSVRVKFVADEGVAMDTVALTVGFGHTGFDSFNEGKGDNVLALFTAAVEAGTDLTYMACPAVKIAKA